MKLLKSLRKRGLALFLSLVLCLSLVTPAFAAEFQDLQDAIDGKTDNGQIVKDTDGNDTDRRGYGSDISEEQNQSKFEIEASYERDDDGNVTKADVTLNADVTYDENKDGRDAKTVTVDTGSDVTLNLNDHNVIGSWSSSDSIKVENGASLTVNGGEAGVPASPYGGELKNTIDNHVSNFGEMTMDNVMVTGSIRNYGTMWVDNSTVNSNLNNYRGEMWVDNVTVGFNVDNQSNMWVKNSTVRSNVTNEYSGTMTMENTSVKNGVINNTDCTMTVDSSTVGGYVHNNGGTMTVQNNTTVEGNVFNSGTLDLTDSTVAKTVYDSTEDGFTSTDSVLIDPDVVKVDGFFGTTGYTREIVQTEDGETAKLTLYPGAYGQVNLYSIDAFDHFSDVEVVIAEGTTSVNGSLYKDCTSLTSLTIPADTSFYKDTFSRFKNLKNVTVTGEGGKILAELSIPEGALLSGGSGSTGAFRGITVLCPGSSSDDEIFHITAVKPDGTLIYTEYGRSDKDNEVIITTTTTSDVTSNKVTTTWTLPEGKSAEVLYENAWDDIILPDRSIVTGQDGSVTIYFSYCDPGGNPRGLRIRPDGVVDFDYAVRTDKDGNMTLYNVYTTGTVWEVGTIEVPAGSAPAAVNISDDGEVTITVPAGSKVCWSYEGMESPYYCEWTYPQETEIDACYGEGAPAVAKLTDDEGMDEGTVLIYTITQPDDEEGDLIVSAILITLPDDKSTSDVPVDENGITTVPAGSSVIKYSVDEYGNDIIGDAISCPNGATMLADGTIIYTVVSEKDETGKAVITTTTDKGDDTSSNVETTVILPEGGEAKTSPDSTTELPANTTVVDRDGSETTYPGGAEVDKDGNVTGTGVTDDGDVVISGVTSDEDGNKTPTKTTIDVPEDKKDQVKVNPDGTVEVPAGSTITDKDGNPVTDKDGNEISVLPNDSIITIDKDGNITVTEKQDTPDIPDAPDTPNTPVTPVIPETPVVPGYGVSVVPGVSTTTIADQNVPLAGLTSAAQFLEALRQHEGIEEIELPEDFKWADHEYAQAIYWGLQEKLVADTEEQPFDPDEIITVAVLRNVLTAYVEIYKKLDDFIVTVEGEDDEIVMDLGERLTAFYGELEAYLEAQEA